VDQAKSQDITTGLGLFHLAAEGLTKKSISNLKFQIARKSSANMQWQALRQALRQARGESLPAYQDWLYRHSGLPKFCVFVKCSLLTKSRI
jgi:hypothetical protein